MSATLAQLRSDPLSEHIWIAEIAYYDTVGLTSGTLYYSTKEFGTSSSDTPASQQYEARMQNGYNFLASTGDVGPYGGALPAREGGSIVLLQSNGDLDFLRYYSIDGRSVVIKHGGVSPVYGAVAYTDYETVFTGTVDGQPLIGIDTVTLAIKNKDSILEFPIQDRKYSGGTYWLYFDGTNDYVDCGNETTYNFTSSSFTVEFYIYVESYPGTEASIINRGSSTVDGWAIRLGTAGGIKLQTYQSGASQTTTSNPLTLKKRQHVAVVRNGSSCYIYIDGVLSVSSSGTHTNPTTAARNLFFGKNNGGTVFFAGFLDEIRIWNTARTAGQINAYRGRQLQAAEVVPALLGYWKCDDGTGGTVTDSSDATYHSDSTVANGTISGATWYPSLQGGEDLEGAPLPDVFGQREGFVPVLVDEPRLIYQVHSGSVYSMVKILVGGVEIAYDAAPGTTYTSMSAFLAASTAAGFYERLVTEYGSWFRLGSAPNKPVTAIIQGDNTGGSGYGDASTYRYTAADIVRYIVCNRGPQPLTDPTDLDDTSFDDLNTDNDAVVGAACYDEVTIVEVVGFLLNSIGAVGFFTRSGGLYRVFRFNGVSGKTVALDFTENDVEEDTLESINVSLPIWGVDLRFRKNDLVHSTSDIAASVISSATPPASANWRYLMTEWRTSSPRNVVIRSSYKGATIMQLDTGLQLYSEAAVESSRLLDLYDQQGQCLKGFFKIDSMQLDRMDFVTFHYQDLDSQGQLQSRLGTEEGTIFVILAIEDDVESGGAWLTLYREAIS